MDIQIRKEERGFFVTKQINILGILLTMYLIRKSGYDDIYIGFGFSKKRKYRVIFKTEQEARNWFSHDPDIHPILA